MHDFIPFYSPYAPALMLALLPLIIIAALWTIIIKGYALWHAARGGQQGWFVVLLVVNTLGILEIIYLLWFRPRSHTRHSRASHTPVPHSSSQA